MIENEENATISKTKNIQAFLDDSTIFLTGVTGFLGHVLLEKLLRSCPSIRKIYILFREKSGKDVNTRFRDLFNTPIFDNMKAQCPNYLSKVAPIKGDCIKPNLGISESDRYTLENEVNIVFHVAATVKFDAPLRHAVQMNVRCTGDLLDMAKNMKNLQSFMYVSTAFSYCVGRHMIEEKIYNPPLDPVAIINLIDNLDDATLDKITPVLLEPHPNSYVYTKAIAESLCLHKSSGLPIAIFRPAIVISTAEEPIPGWINNMYGPTGIVAAAGLGLLRTICVDGNCKANVVPCDYVINAMIASAWNTARTWQINRKNCENPVQIPIYNFSSTDTKNSLTWKQFMHENELMEPEMPFSFSVWKYSLILNKYRLLNQICMIFFHLLPAFFVDKVAILCGKKPRLWATYQKLHKLTKVLAYFSTRNWIIPNTSLQQVWNSLSDYEKQMFNFDLDTLDWKKYFRNHVLGIRMYILKDKSDTIPSAQRKRKRLIFIHYALIGIFISMIIYTIFYVTRTVGLA